MNEHILVASWFDKFPIWKDLDIMALLYWEQGRWMNGSNDELNPDGMNKYLNAIRQLHDLIKILMNICPHFVYWVHFWIMMLTVLEAERDEEWNLWQVWEINVQDLITVNLRHDDRFWLHSLIDANRNLYSAKWWFFVCYRCKIFGWW
jgi:hypothetical protein